MEKISLKELINELLQAKLTITICMLISFAFGFLIYKITPNEYASRVQLIVISNDENPRQSQLGTLASLAGLNLNSNNIGISAPTYEFILSSTSFLLEIVNQQIEFEGDSVYVGDYLTQRMIVGWREKFRSLVNHDVEKITMSSQFSDLTKSRDNADVNIPILKLEDKVGKSIRRLRNSLEFVYEVGKPINISLALQDPEVSAQVVKIIVEKLEDYIHQHTRENKEENLFFLENEVKKAKDDLYQIQSSLASAKDRNVNVNKALAGVNIERLELSYSQARKIYTDLLAQLDNSKIQVENEKALFIIIEPPLVLNIDYPTAPRGIIYILLTIFIGLFGAFAFVLFRSFIRVNQQ